jgi:chemosensory pili system protein ChpA (sensor histidine kinase/response regulator)
MPRMDGFDLLRHVRQDPRLSAIPVVMISSRTASRHREHAMALGATAYLGKPFQETALLALLKQLCANSSEATV